MKNLLLTQVGRLRILAFLEGTSLLALIFVGVPLKYMYQIPSINKVIGPIHGALFLLFLLNTMTVGVEQKWKFTSTTWKVILACFIPFGTFYIDHKILTNRITMTSMHFN
jgi:integral membrane protein